MDISATEQKDHTAYAVLWKEYSASLSAFPEATRTFQQHSSVKKGVSKHTYLATRNQREVEDSASGKAAVGKVSTGG